MKQMPPGEESVSLLWTGGWDSTFHLLRLLTIRRCSVAPFYLIDAERRSTGAELLTMKHIKESLFKEYPRARELLQATRYFAVADISPDRKITEAFQSVLKENFLGSQYEWLPRFCKEKGITDIQLCIHRDDKAHFVTEQIVSKSSDGLHTTFRVDPKFKKTREHLLFRYFSFPIYDLTKRDMLAMADEHGWGKLMRMTWFCLNPTSKMEPCGKCNACLYTIEEGLAWRIPLRRQIAASFFKSIIRPLKSLSKTVFAEFGLLKYMQKGP